VDDAQLEGVVNAALTDTFASVRRIALDAAATRLDPSLTLRSAPGMHNRLATSSLAGGLGKWNSLLVLVETADGSDAELQAVVDRLLREWLGRQNRAYSQPTPTQLESIRRALAANGDRLERHTREGIEQSVAYWSPK
jgi:hypothetical protein